MASSKSLQPFFKIPWESKSEVQRQCHAIRISFLPCLAEDSLCYTVHLMNLGKVVKPARGLLMCRFFGFRSLSPFGDSYVKFSRILAHISAALAVTSEFCFGESVAGFLFSCASVPSPSSGASFRLSSLLSHALAFAMLDSKG